jgi:hypothetical protein
MSSNNLATVVVPELVELGVVAGYDPFPRIVDVATCGPLVGERSHVVVQGIERPRRHRAPVKLLQKIRTPIHEVASFGRSFLNQVVKLSVCAGSGSSLNVTMITLAVLTILCHGDPYPTPTPTPIPF